MSAHLFSPITLGNLELSNRIAVAPMCQYMADDGSATDWHIYHWMNLALSGASMVTVEMTDVERRGRISHGCLGMYSESNEAAAKRALDAAKKIAYPGTKFGTQLAHAGRKASCRRPWEGSAGPLQANEDPWQVVSASAVPFANSYQTPVALDEDGILGVIDAFGNAAKRAERAGFDFIEIHGAHGYLINQFLSPLSNHRTDKWGGSLDNRMRLIVEVASRIRKDVPDMMVGARLSVTEWVDGGMSPEDNIEVAKALKDVGIAYICCTSGGNSPLQQVPSGQGYQVHLAEQLGKGAGIPVRAVGAIDEPRQANDIITQGKADMVALARALMADPRWPARAAAVLGQDFKTVPQLVRAAHLPKKWAAAAH